MKGRKEEVLHWFLTIKTLQPHRIDYFTSYSDFGFYCRSDGGGGGGGGGCDGGGGGGGEQDVWCQVKK